MKKNLICTRSLILYAFLCLCSFTATSQSCYNIVGYVVSWQGDNAAIDYTKYTHLNYAFGIPNSNGTVGAIDNASKLSDLVSRGHATNTKVLLSIGGWLTSSPDNTPYDAIAQNSTSINTFVNTCANLITQYNLDGIDIDWEYPNSQTNWNNIMNPLATRIHGMGKLLTAATPANSYAGDRVGNLTILDLVNIMSYDCNCPSNAPYNESVADLSYWAGRGVPVAKRILGVPFYSSDNNTNLHVQKAQYVKAGHGGGIMIWEITSPGDINSIASTLGTLCKGGTQPPPPTCNTVNLPATIQAESYCDMSGVQTESTTDTGGGLNVGYIDTNDWMHYKVNVPTTGTYTVQYRVASLSGGGSIRLEPYGGGTAYGTIAVPSTGGWQTWTTISQTVSLSAGVRDISVTAAAGGFNINWLSITGGGGSTSTNLAYNRPVTTSSNENTTNTGPKAVDGNGTTRWSSAYSDPQWIYVDLGAVYKVNRIKITWETALGKNYYLEGSTNASTWTNIKTITNNTSLVNDNTGLSANARYIRMYGTARGTVYGYSIYELEVYGTYVSARMATEELQPEEEMLTAFPNPAAGMTTIQVNLKEAGHAVVNVSASVGNVIAELHRGQLDAGRHEFIFNTEGLKPGMYFYSVILNGRRTTKKLLKQ